jgi:hypothetical protein
MPSNDLYNVFDILDNDERVIVASNEDMGIIITWNRSQTLQLWQNTWEGFVKINVRTLSENPVTYGEARLRALMWLIDLGKTNE